MPNTTAFMPKRNVFCASSGALAADLVAINLLEESIYPGSQSIPKDGENFVGFGSAESAVADGDLVKVVGAVERFLDEVPVRNLLAVSFALVTAGRDHHVPHCARSAFYGGFESVHIVGSLDKASLVVVDVSKVCFESRGAEDPAEGRAWDGVLEC